MITTDAQVRKLMEELSRGKELGVAACRAGMGRKAAAKYRTLGKLPSELKGPRAWRTREDPFAEDWDGVAAMLTDAPELEAKIVFEDLLERRPGADSPGQVRTFQRKVKQWRAQFGPPKRIYFAQEHRPGEAMQTDFTWCTELEITIAGEEFPHMLCHVVLPYSNWEWATVCRSESLEAIRHGVQAGVFRLGRRPEWHQTDNSTAATHDVAGGKRAFNAAYEALMTHLGMKPRTIGIGKSEQNGDVESLNGALKRRLKQHLLLRGSRDFESVQAYEAWLQQILERVNGTRSERLSEDLAAMAALNVKRLPEYTVEEVRVSSWSTIRVRHNAYSVPARLRDEVVRVRVFDDRLEVFYGGRCELTVERLRGRHGHRINYRHVIWDLVRRPGAFARYKYREDLFPSVAFRRAYDAFQTTSAGTKGGLEYLRVLHLAASTLECEVQSALELLLDDGSLRDSDAVKLLVAPRAPEVPQLDLETDLPVCHRLSVLRHPVPPDEAPEPRRRVGTRADVTQHHDLGIATPSRVRRDLAPPAGRCCVARPMSAWGLSRCMHGDIVRPMRGRDTAAEEQE